MATSKKHSGFKRLVDRNPTLAILVNGAECLTFRADSTGAYGGLQLGVPTYTAAGCADGAGISLATGYGASSSNRFSAFEVIADTGSTDLTGDTYQACIHGKLNIGTTQSNASLMAGLFSLDVANGKNLSANYFALRGHLDFWGSSSISGTSFVGAVSAYVENEATTTVGAAQHLDGVDIYQVGAPSVNATGQNSAVNIRSSSAAAKWKKGIYMIGSNVLEGIRVGDLSGDTVGSGVHLNSSSTAAIRFYSDSDEAGGSSANWRTMTVRHMDVGTTQTGELRAIEGVLAAVNCSWAHTYGAVFGSLEVTTALDQSGVMAGAVVGRVGAGTTSTITVSSDGILCAVGAVSNITGALASDNGQTAAYGVAAVSGKLAFPIGIFMHGNAVQKIMKCGTTTYRCTTSTANAIFSDWRLTTSATSGNNHGFYISMRHTSTSTEFSAGRFYSINTGTVASGSLHGIWATYEESTGGTNSGLSAAGRFTQTAAASVALTGTRTCIQLDSTYANTNTLAGNESFIRFENVNTANKLTGYFIDGVSIDTTAMFTGSGDTTAAKYLKCRINGTPYYMMFAAAAG